MMISKTGPILTCATPQLLINKTADLDYIHWYQFSLQDHPDSFRIWLQFDSLLNVAIIVTNLDYALEHQVTDKSGKLMEFLRKSEED